MFLSIIVIISWCNNVNKLLKYLVFMSRVIDGHGTSLDYSFRATYYGQIADFLEGKPEVRKEQSGLLRGVSARIDFALWQLGVGSSPKSLDSRQGDDFFDDFMEVTLAGRNLRPLDPSLKEDLGRYKDAVNRANSGEVLVPQNEACLFFRKMAERAHQEANSPSRVYG